MPVEYRLTPIGTVRSPRTEPGDDNWGRVVAEITLDGERFSPSSVEGLSAFSHIEVIYVFDRVAEDDVEQGARRPRNTAAWPEVGIFAQRARRRPNRLGSSVCRLIDVAHLTLVVAGLDAIDATPVLDVKPYLRELAPREQVRQPSWSTELMARYW